MDETKPNLRFSLFCDQLETLKGNTPLHTPDDAWMEKLIARLSRAGERAQPDKRMLHNASY